MASADVILSAPDVAAVPMDYDVPPAQEIMPLCVTASLDGAAAGASWIPMLELLTPAGQVVFRSPINTVIAAGGSADASWFPLRVDQANETSPVSAYEALILDTPGIRGYWKLDETGAAPTAIDSGPARANLTYQNTPTLGVPPLADGTAVTFTRASSESVGGFTGVKVDNLQSDNVMTVECWVKTTAAVLQGLMWSDSSGPNGRWFQLYQAAAGGVIFVIFNTAANGFGTGPIGAINDGVKHLVHGVYDGATLSIYIDAVFKSSLLVPAGQRTLATSNMGFSLGCTFSGFGSADFFDGTLDECSVYNRALTPAQIAAHYAAG